MEIYKRYFCQEMLSIEHIFPPPNALFPILDGKIPRPRKYEKNLYFLTLLLELNPITSSSHQWCIIAINIIMVYIHSLLANREIIDDGLLEMESGIGWGGQNGQTYLGNTLF